MRGDTAFAAWVIEAAEQRLGRLGLRYREGSSPPPSEVGQAAPNDRYSHMWKTGCTKKKRADNIALAEHYGASMLAELDRGERQRETAQKYADMANAAGLQNEGKDWTMAAVRKLMQRIRAEVPD